MKTVMGIPRRRGQSLVEFALILPVFLLILMIILDYGRYVTLLLNASTLARTVAAMASRRSDIDPSTAQPYLNFPNAAAAARVTAQPLNLDAGDGRIYIARLVWDSGGNVYRVRQFEIVGSYSSEPPKILSGAGLNSPIPLSALPGAAQFPIPRDGASAQEIYLVEVQLRFRSISPFLQSFGFEYAGRDDGCAHSWAFF